jgi:acetolactate synthase-1/2/3 large subunit
VPGLADVIVERLRATGARALFGVPGGGGNLDLIEAARLAGLPFVLTATETAAAIAAIAQTEVTGAPGACATTLGPGAASVVNGVACALLDRAPILVCTDSHPAGAEGRFTHQHLDQIAMFASLTKWSGRLTSADGAAQIGRAFEALAGLPPGPVHLDWPGDVTAGEGSGSLNPSKSANDPPPVRDADAPAALAALVSHARKPLLIAGLGARTAADADAIRRFCARHQVPAMVTYKAKGVVPDAHPCFAGVFTNGAIERPLIEESDLVIGVGLDPVELLPRPWTFTQPVVGIGRWRMPDDHVPFAGQWVIDPSAGLTALGELIGPTEWDLEGVARTVREQRRRIELPAQGMTADRIVAVAAEALGATHRVAVDAGAHMFPATLGWPVAEPNGLLISNGLSTMGFALPAAIGAALVDKPVVALTGDGGLLMCAGELLTAAREKLRIIVIVFSDASLSLIEVKQQARRLPLAGIALGRVKWAALAESVGVAGFVARTEVELGRAIGQALAHDGPSLIEATTDRSTYGELLKVIRG